MPMSLVTQVRKLRNAVPRVLCAICMLMACGFSGAIAATPESLSAAERMAAHQDSVAKMRMRSLKLAQLANKEDDVRSLCSGVDKCLGIKFDFCTADDFKPWPKVKYDAEFCAPYHEIVKRGFPADLRQPMATEIYARLGRQYRAIYENKGTLPLGGDVISYLFDNMPFTADLINAYLNTNYTLEYASRNHRFFNGSNGRSLSGEFYWALQDSAGQKLGMRNLFFGYGHAQVLRWSLHGSAIAFLDMEEVSRRELKYKLTAIVFPSNSVLNSIMQMNVFKKVVNEKIDHIVADIKKASGKYFGGDKEPMLKNAKLKSQENVQYVIDFENVVNGAPWKLGDYEKLRKEREKQRTAPAPLKLEDPRMIK